MMSNLRYVEILKFCVKNSNYNIIDENKKHFIR